MGLRSSVEAWIIKGVHFRNEASTIGMSCTTTIARLRIVGSFLRNESTGANCSVDFNISLMHSIQNSA